MEASAQVAAMGQSYPLPRGVIRCRFIFSGKNDEPTPDFPILSISYLSRFPPPLSAPCRTELVEDETYLWVLTRYVHLNPVRAGLAATPEAWIWSSCPGYYPGKEVPHAAAYQPDAPARVPVRPRWRLGEKHPRWRLLMLRCFRLISSRGPVFLGETVLDDSLQSADSPAGLQTIGDVL